MRIVNVEGLEEFLSVLAKEEAAGEKIHVFFCGTHLESGESWCPDCATAEPLIRGVIEKKENGVFIHCTVGNRESWKDASNPFRTHTASALTAVPTFLIWGKPNRLIEEECFKVEDIEKFLNEN